MLKASKIADSGLKLEVNGKILDSCTNLMKAIRALVQKSRVLQAEIVASGNAVSIWWCEDGLEKYDFERTFNNSFVSFTLQSSNLSAKEFYKRNHQWTEGLISAAKAVGMGAKYLL